MEQIFKESELPWDDFSFLSHDNKLVLGQKDMEALLAGRRTNLIPLKNLWGEGYGLHSLDAKISLYRALNGEVTIQLHPIYKKPVAHPLLLEQEQQQLESRALANVLKRYTDSEGKTTSWLIEYDPECKEFIATDPEKVIVPALINATDLTVQDQEKYKYGGVIELPDGTLIQRRASYREGITANRDALVFTFLEGNSYRYLLKDQLRNLYNAGQQQFPADSFQFNKALQQLRGQNFGRQKERLESSPFDEMIQGGKNVSDVDLLNLAKKDNTKRNI